MRVLAILLSIWAAASQADPVDDVMRVAQARFDRMPSLQMVDRISGNCGAKSLVNNQIAYCTTTNSLLMSPAARALPQAPYLVAHVLGHAVQVKHGVADVALATIRANRAQEPFLRTNVEQMVDCIAGLLVFEAGHAPANLNVWMSDDPFAGPHWGRKPLTEGPVISLPLDMRNDWFRRGQGGFIAACATEVFGSDLLVKAYRE